MTDSILSSSAAQLSYSVTSGCSALPLWACVCLLTLLFVPTALPLATAVLSVERVFPTLCSQFVTCLFDIRMASCAFALWWLAGSAEHQALRASRVVADGGRPFSRAESGPTAHTSRIPFTQPSAEGPLGQETELQWVLERGASQGQSFKCCLRPLMSEPPAARGLGSPCSPPQIWGSEPAHSSVPA